VGRGHRRAQLSRSRKTSNFAWDKGVFDGGEGDYADRRAEPPVYRVAPNYGWRRVF
jgi:hypothetical protein